MNFDPEEFFSKNTQPNTANPFTETKTVEEKINQVSDAVLDGGATNNEVVAGDIMSRALAQAGQGSDTQQQISQGNGEIGGQNTYAQVSVEGAGIQPTGELSIVGQPTAEETRKEEISAMEKLRLASQNATSISNEISLSGFLVEEQDEFTIPEIDDIQKIDVPEINIELPTSETTPVQLQQLEPVEQVIQVEQVQAVEQVPVQTVEEPVMQQPVQEQPVQQTMQEAVQEQPVQAVPQSTQQGGSARDRIREQARLDRLMEEGKAVDSMGNVIAPLVSPVEEDDGYSGQESTSEQIVGGEADVNENEDLLKELTGGGTQTQEQPQQQNQEPEPYEFSLPEQPTYEQPTYQEPAYQEPAYQEPAYQQQYQEPTYQEPAYQQQYQEPQQQQYQEPQQQQYQGAILPSNEKIFRTQPIVFSSSSINLQNFEENQNVIADAYIKDIKYTPYSRGKKTDFTFIVANGEILHAVYWGTLDGYTDETVRSLKDSVVAVSGKWGLYRGKKQLTVDSIAPAVNTAVNNYIATTGDLTQFDNIFRELYESISNEALKTLVYEIFFTRDLVSACKSTPAASTVHDSTPDGLYRHTMKVAYLAYTSARLYEGINTDVVVVSALLHDIGKIFEITKSGDYTEDGVLFGHIYMGARYVEGVMDYLTQHGIEINPDHRKNIIHCILSHHTSLEWGAVTEPATAEAKLLSSVDNVDARVTGLLDYMGNTRKSQIPYPRQTIFNLNQ